MAIASKNVEYKDQETLLEGYLAWDDQQQGPRPTILIAHAWDGRTDFVCNQAKKIASLGYAAFCLDAYGKGIYGANPEKNATLMQPFLDDRKMLQQRLQSGVAAAVSESVVDRKKMIAVGYCFGGLSVLDLARYNAPLLGVISYHGILQPPPRLSVDKIKPKVMVLHGYQDPMANPQAMLAFCQEMASAQAEWQLHAYGNTLHAFTNPQANSPADGVLYSALADQRSWRSSLNFFEELFN